MSDTLKTLLLGAAGLAVAIGLSIATLHLTHEEVGLTAEPINAGIDLAAPTSGVTGATAATGEKPAKRRKPGDDDASNQTTGGNSQGQADSGGDSTPGNSDGGGDSGDDGGDGDSGGDDSGGDDSSGDDSANDDGNAEGGEDHDDDD